MDSVHPHHGGAFAVGIALAAAAGAAAVTAAVAAACPAISVSLAPMHIQLPAKNAWASPVAATASTRAFRSEFTVVGCEKNKRHWMLEIDTSKRLRERKVVSGL